jgi:hypothetical protein
MKIRLLHSSDAGALLAYLRSHDCLAYVTENELVIEALHRSVSKRREQSELRRLVAAWSHEARRPPPDMP